MNQPPVASNAKSIIMLGLNIQSLRCHRDELLVELDSFNSKPSVIALTETWLTENDNTSTLNLDGYQHIESKIRTTGQLRGGVGFYVKEGLTYKAIEYESGIECAIINVCIDFETFRNFCVVYRPDSKKLKTFMPEFEDLLNFLRTLKHDTVILGDFNIDTIKESKFKTVYENVLRAYDFERQNSEPTRVTPTTATCLDHIITSYPINTMTISTTISDHFTVIGEIPVSSIAEQQKPNVLTRNLKNLKGDKALNFLFLLDQKLQKLLTSNELNMESIAKTIMLCVDRFAPEKQYNPKCNSNEWINNRVKNAIIKRNKLFKLWISDNNTHNREQYNMQRNIVTKLIKQAKREANFQKLGENPSSKILYRTLKCHTRTGEENSIVPDPDILNKFFTNVGQFLAANVPPTKRTFRTERSSKSMVICGTDDLEKAKIIKLMKNKKSSGHDGISNEILKCCSPIIEKYLAIAFNDCIFQRKFPDTLKLAKVIPLYKKGDRKNPENYRPISLLSSLSKVFEKLLHKRMINFVNKNKLLSPEQFGFRSKHSCVHAISTLTEYMRNEIDRKRTGQACFIDLQKAFDSLNHEILLEKLFNYGFRGPIHEILVDYLRNRCQYVSSHCKKSCKLPITTGVPQGSILGPLLFLIYVNDLPAFCKNENKIAMFADDTSILKSSGRNNLNLQDDLDRVIDWFSFNKLSVNTSKCESMHFGCGISKHLTILNENVGMKTHCKYLGLYLDSKLTFREHIKYVSKKLNKFCGLIYRIRDLYPIKCLLTFYESYAKSVITYGLLVYGSACKSKIEEIEMAQRRIIRAIFFRKKYDSIKDIFERKQILTVFELYVNEIFREVFYQLRSESPVIFLNKGFVNKYDTRSARKGHLQTSYCRTVAKSKSIQNVLTKGHNWLKTFNLIPENLTKMTSKQAVSYLRVLRDLYIAGDSNIVSIFF